MARTACTWMLLTLVAAGSGACDFDAPDLREDAPVVRIDAAPDAPPDTPPPSLRVTDDLIAVWTFDDAPGSTLLADTSGVTPPVPLRVVSSAQIAAPTIAGGVLDAPRPGRVESTEGTRLAAACVAGGGVTLEAWAKPSTIVQGAATQAVFVAGLAINIGSRDVALLQAGDRWMGLVRTSADPVGGPPLHSVAPVTAEMVHLVLVADATRRALYVDGVEVESGPGGSLATWNVTYPMMLIDEYQHARQWTGSLALVALYSRALSPEEITQNFTVGPAAN